MPKYKDPNMEYVSQTQTLVGQKKRTLIDKETGEIFEVDQITKRAHGQKAFWKLYLLDFLQVLEILESKQVGVVIHLLENIDPANNTYIGTYRKIAERSSISLDTVFKVMKKLIACKFLTKIQDGVYQISPTILMRGSEHKKNILLSYYKEPQKKDPFKQTDPTEPDNQIKIDEELTKSPKNRKVRKTP